METSLKKTGSTCYMLKVFYNVYENYFRFVYLDDDCDLKNVCDIALESGIIDYDEKMHICDVQKIVKDDCDVMFLRCLSSVKESINADVSESNALKLDKWRIKVLYLGDKYGLNNCLVHDSDKPLVEFYDTTHKDKFGDEGQFVSRYYLETIKGHTCELCLDTDNRDCWTVREIFMRIISLWLNLYH